MSDDAKQIKSGERVTWQTGNADSKTGKVLCFLPAGKNAWDPAREAQVDLVGVTWKGGNPRHYVRAVAGYAVLVERAGQRGPLKPEVYTPTAVLLERQNPQAKRVKAEG
jgi:hypothetical protein